MVRRAASSAAWWLVLFGFWLLLVGTTRWVELVAGACAAALGTVLAEALRAQRLLGFRLEARWLARTWRLPLEIARDFAVLAWALLLHVTRVRPVRSAY